MIAVTVVTSRAASSEDLGDGDYREIFQELRGKTTLRGFAEFIGSQYSFAWWSKYERGEAELTRQGRQELRRAVGLPALPLTAGEVLASVDPDATMWHIGEGPADRVVMVGQGTHEPIGFRLNGRLNVTEEAAVEGHVTGVTRARRGGTRGSIVIGRGAWEKLNFARGERGLSWEEFLAPLLTS